MSSQVAREMKRLKDQFPDKYLQHKVTEMWYFVGLRITNDKAVHLYTY